MGRVGTVAITLEAGTFVCRLDWSDTTQTRHQPILPSLMDGPILGGQLRSSKILYGHCLMMLKRPRRLPSMTVEDVTTTDTDYIYRLGTTAPSAPSGGTTNETHTPSNWTRTEPIPTSTENVYRAERTREPTKMGHSTPQPAWGSVTNVADAVHLFL